MNYLQQELYDLVKSDRAIFDFIQEASLDGVWYWDLEQPENEWLSEKFWRVLGYDPAVMPHKVSSWQTIIHPEDLQVAIRNFNQHCEDPNHPYDQIVRYRHGTGKTVWVRCRGLGIRDAQGKVIRMLGAHVDITREMEAEAQLKIQNRRLEVSEKQFRGAFEYSPIGMALVSLEGQWLKVNRQLCKMFGYGDVGFDHAALPAITYAAFDEADLSFVHELTSGQREFYEVEKSYRHNDGSVVWVHLNVSAVRDEQGVPLHFVAQFQDISRQKKAEHQTSVTLAQLSEYKYALDQAAIVAITDLAGIIKYANDEFCAVSGYSRFELVGQDHRIVNSGWHDKAFIQNLWNTISEGKVWKGELRNKAKGDRFYWVDTTIVPFIDDTGKPYQFMSIQWNITSRMEAMAATRKIEALLQSSLESYHDVFIFLIDLDGRYLFFNDRFAAAYHRTYGTTVRVGENIFDGITNPQDADRIRDNITRALKGESHVTVEQYANPVSAFFETRYSPILDTHDEIIGVTVLSADITDRKQAADSILALNKELEAFSYTIAHDLRTPLRVINGYSKMLLEEEALSHDEENRFLNVISKNTIRMGHLIDDLLNFSRLGRLSVAREWVDIQDMVQNIIEEQRMVSSHQEIECVLGHIEPLYCDRNLIHQVLVNLISNAVKYSGKKSKSVIQIGSAKDGEDITYYVKDNGEGFDMQFVDKIFMVFQRLYKESEFEGTGVGLAIVQRIIQLHGGRVWAESMPGEGATFYFSLHAYHGHDAR